MMQIVKMKNKCKIIFDYCIAPIEHLKWASINQNDLDKLNIFIETKYGDKIYAKDIKTMTISTKDK